MLLARPPRLTQGGCLADPPYIEDSGQPGELLLTPGTPLELLWMLGATLSRTQHHLAQGWAGPEHTEDGLARRVLRVEGVQVWLPQLPREEAAEGRGGAQRHSARFGQAPLLFRCEDVKTTPLAREPCPWEPPVRFHPRLMWKSRWGIPWPNQKKLVQSRGTSWRQALL